MASNSTLETCTEPARAWHAGGRIHIELVDGQALSFPVRGNPRLSVGTAAQLDAMELSYDGLHWEELDEDLSIEGMLNGDWGQVPAP